MEKQIKQLLKDEFGFIESEYNQTSKTIITFLSEIIEKKMLEIKDLKDINYQLKVKIKNQQIMIDGLQEEKREIIERYTGEDLH